MHFHIESLDNRMEVLKFKNLNFIFFENKIWDIERQCLKLKHGLDLKERFYRIDKEGKYFFYQNEERDLILKNVFDYFELFQYFNEIKKRKCDTETLLKENLMIYPFNFNFLHISAIINDFREIDLKSFDWIKFKKLSVPINAFLSLNFQGLTCLDIALAKQNKILLKKIFEVIFNSFEKHEDLYQKIKLFTYDFNYKKKNLIYFMISLLDLFEEDTEILNNIFTFMLVSLKSENFPLIVKNEMTSPIFLISKNMGYLRNTTEIERIIDDNDDMKKRIFKCLLKKGKEEQSKKAQVLCSIFLVKNITELSPETSEFWGKLLKLSPSNPIFNNKNLYTIIKYKRETYGRAIYLKNFTIFSFFFLLYLINFVYLFPDRTNDTDDVNGGEIVSVIFDIFDLLYFLWYLFSEVKQFKIQKSDYFSSLWNIINGILIFGAFSTLLLDIIHILAIDFDFFPVKVMIAITFLFFWTRLLSFARGFEGTGFLIRLVEQVVMDMRSFLFMIFLVMLAFSSAGILLQENNDYGPFFIFNLMYRLMLGDYTNYDNYVLNDQNMIVLWIGMILFTIFLSIIMLNLLIAIIGATFADVVALEASNRTYELLSVLHEIDQFLSVKQIEALRKEGLIGDYLVALHNLSGFSSNNISEATLKNQISVLNDRLEKMEKVLIEKIEKNVEAIVKFDSKFESFEKTLDSKFESFQKTQFDNFEKILTEIKGSMVSQEKK